jgi:hypothetical protein
MVSANLDLNLGYAQGVNDHIRKLVCGTEFLGHLDVTYPKAPRHILSAEFEFLASRYAR